MQRIAGTQRQGPAPRTRWGGVVTFRGVEYPTVEALQEALTTATVDAGPVYRVRLTRKGRSLARALAAEAGR